MLTLYYKTRFSYLFVGLLVGLPILSVAAVLDSSLPGLIQTSLLMVLMLSALYTYYASFQHPHRILVCWYRKQQWYIELANQRKIPVRLLPESYISKGLTILRFMDDEAKRKHTLLLFCDAQSKAERIGFRRISRLAK